MVNHLKAYSATVCSWGVPFSEKTAKIAGHRLHIKQKKVDFRNKGLRAKMRHIWRLASWGMAFLLNQVCSSTTFVYHKKSEWERYKTYLVEASIITGSIWPAPSPDGIYEFFRSRKCARKISWRAQNVKAYKRTRWMSFQQHSYLLCNVHLV